EADYHPSIRRGMVREFQPNAGEVCGETLGARVRNLTVGGVADLVGATEEPFAQPLIRTVGSQAIVGRRRYDAPDRTKIANNRRPVRGATVAKVHAGAHGIEGNAICTPCSGLNDRDYVDGGRLQSSGTPKFRSIAGFWTVGTRGLVRKI